MVVSIKVLRSPTTINFDDGLSGKDPGPIYLAVDVGCVGILLYVSM
jgi:hypothetical protein